MTMDVFDRIATSDPRVSATGSRVALDGVAKDFGDHRVCMAST